MDEVPVLQDDVADVGTYLRDWNGGGHMRCWAALAVVAAVLTGCAAGCTNEKSRPFQLKGPVGSHGPGLAVALYQTVGVRMVPGNRIQWANNGAVFNAITDELKQAKTSINIVMFIWRPGRASEQVLEVLTERARDGVACRVLVDPLGSPNFEAQLKPRLEAAGCRAHLFRPLPADENLARNHRKLVIVDGKVAITGGLAIQDEWLGEGLKEKEWRDTNATVRGPVVAQMQQAFAENWQEASGELLPASDFPTLAEPVPGMDGAGEGWAAFVGSTANPEVTRAERLTQLMVRAAQKRLWIAQSYFTPNDALAKQLVERARAGVDVRILAPGDLNDQKVITVAQRAAYDTLLQAGVRIFEYQPSMMHAKTMLVGSINYDPLSFNLLEEGSLVLEDDEAARGMEAFFLADLEHAKEIRAERAAR